MAGLSNDPDGIARTFDAAVDNCIAACRQRYQTITRDVAHHRDGLCRVKRYPTVYVRTLDIAVDADVAVSGVEINARAADAARSFFTDRDASVPGKDGYGVVFASDAAVDGCCLLYKSDAADEL